VFVLIYVRLLLAAADRFLVAVLVLGTHLSAQRAISFLAFRAETNDRWIIQRITMTTLLTYQTIPDRIHDFESVILDTVRAAHGVHVHHKFS
jgi:hypothetical protein